MDISYPRVHSHPDSRLPSAGDCLAPESAALATGESCHQPPHRTRHSLGLPFIAALVVLLGPAITPVKGDGLAQLGCGVPTWMPDPWDPSCLLKRDATCVFPGPEIRAYGSATCGYRLGVGGSVTPCGYPIAIEGDCP
jgi:hypothetical protein